MGRSQEAPSRRPAKRTTTAWLPRYLEFHDALKTVHRVVMFPELQALPDDEGLMLRREYAQAKLDILRLAVNRFCEPALSALLMLMGTACRLVSLICLWCNGLDQMYLDIGYGIDLGSEVRWQKQIEFGRGLMRSRSMNVRYCY